MLNQSTISGLAMLAKVVCASMGIKLIIDGKQASTNGKSITLPRLSLDGTPEGRNNVVAYLYHEGGHVCFTDFKVITKLSGGVLHIWNVIEDPRIEKKMWVRFPGSKRKLSDLVDNAIKTGMFTPVSAANTVRELLSAAILFSMRTEVTQQSQLAGMANDAVAALAGKIGAPLVAKVMSYARSGALATNTAGAVEAATAICNAVKDAAEEEKKEEAGKDASADGGQPGNGNGAGSDLQQLADELSGMTVAEAKELAKTYDTGTSIGEALSKEAQQNGSAGGGKGGGVSDGTSSEQYHKPGNAWVTLNADAVTQSLRLRVQAFLEAQVTEERRTSSTGADFRASRMIDSMLGSTKIFERRSTAQDFDAAVGLLVDCSGSMGGARMDTAMLAAACAGESVDWVGRSTDGKVALSVAGFDTEYFPVVNFDEPWRTAKRNLGSMTASGGTIYSFPLREMGASLLVREEARKTVIIVSDGEPSSADVAAYRQVVTDLERQSVQLYGILIGCQDSMNLFRNKAIINSIDELPEKLAEMIMASVS